ncbi:hypothetical protein [Rhizobium sp. SL42]|uniref:hypothetical protein n=1 Tax=Rhizobium sp. SL42 TaxID=2806346 RepID=UPI001F2BAFC2|nr:hypothetical protein [Rhizobium sp. SL42]UJW74164.1 hypothetical protein IM739_14935 [Rhizobium sp. SL42]
MTAIFMLVFDLLADRHYYSDIDDVLRAVQIRQLLTNGEWFDLIIHGIDMPGPYLSPWSRLVDLPYVLLALGLRNVTNEATALWWAFRLWQPVLLIVFCWLWCAIAVRLEEDVFRVQPLHAVAAFALMPLTLWEFSPGRIDHHNLQIVVLMLALFGISRWSAAGGFVAGMACGLSFLIGLELAPVLLIVMVGPGFAWIAGVAGSRRVQIFLAAGLALTTLLAGPLLVGPIRFMATECDAFSAPFAVAFLGYAAITAAIMWSVRSTVPYVRLGALVLSAGGLVLALAIAFPGCLQGPYHSVDPVVRGLWLDRVQQEKSFLEFYRVGDTIKIVCLALLVVVLCGALPTFVRRLMRRDAAFVIIFCVAVVLTVFSFAQTRFIRFPAACTLLFLPMVWSEARFGIRATLRAVGAGGAVTLAAGLLFLKLIPSHELRPELLDYLAFDLCTDVDTSPLLTLAPGRIVAPSSLGLFMLDRLPPGMTVNAISFHRAAPGMRRTYDVFVSTDSETRRKAAEPFDYLAVCRYPMVADIPNDTVFAALTRGGGWPGLVPISDSPASGLRLFRIDHESFN